MNYTLEKIPTQLDVAIKHITKLHHYDACPCNKSLLYNHTKLSSILTFNRIVHNCLYELFVDSNISFSTL